MIYAIIMAVAFVAAVCLATVLIVTKKKEDALAQEKSYEQLTPVKAVKRGTEEKTDRRDLISRTQRPERDDFGLVENNPICTASPAATEKYLSLLKTRSGEPLQWLREGTVFVQNLGGAGSVSEEVFLLYLRGKAYKRLYICPFGRNSALVPKDLQLSGDGDAAPYRGSIALEAREKNISIEQVIKKQAMISQNQGTRAGYANPGPKVQGTEKLPEKSAKKEAVSVAVSASPTARRKEPVSVEPSSSNSQQAPASSTFPNYLPGFEPDNIKPSLNKFLAVMDTVYPDGVVLGSTWDHENWDRAAAMLCKYLGYSNGTDFLEAYGYKVEK